MRDPNDLEKKALNELADELAIKSKKYNSLYYCGIGITEDGNDWDWGKEWVMSIRVFDNVAKTNLLIEGASLKRQAAIQLREFANELLESIEKEGIS